MIAKAWQNVLKITIVNCFRHAGFIPSEEDFTLEIEEDTFFSWAEQLTKR